MIRTPDPHFHSILRKTICDRMINEWNQNKCDQRDFACVYELEFSCELESIGNCIDSEYKAK